MATLLVRANPALAGPTSPLGEVISIYDDGFVWGLVDRRLHMIVSIPGTAEEARAIYHAHRTPPIDPDTGEPDPDWTPTEITKFDPDQLPPPVVAKVAAYFERMEQEKESIEAAARPALVAEIARQIGRPLDADEQVMSVPDLVGKFRRHPKRDKFRRHPKRDKFLKAYSASFRTHREGAVADLPLPEVVALNSGQVNRFTHTVPFPVV